LGWIQDKEGLNLMKIISPLAVSNKRCKQAMYECPYCNKQYVYEIRIVKRFKPLACKQCYIDGKLRKKCPICGKYKKSSCFHRLKRNNLTGLQTRCKECGMRHGHTSNYYERNDNVDLMRKAIEWLKKS